MNGRGRPPAAPVTTLLLHNDTTNPLLREAQLRVDAVSLNLAALAEGTFEPTGEVLDALSSLSFNASLYLRAAA